MGSGVFEFFYFTSTCIIYSTFPFCITGLRAEANLYIKYASLSHIWLWSCSHALSFRYYVFSPWVCSLIMQTWYNDPFQLLLTVLFITQLKWSCLCCVRFFTFYSFVLTCSSKAWPPEEHLRMLLSRLPVTSPCCHIFLLHHSLWLKMSQLSIYLFITYFSLLVSSMTAGRWMLLNICWMRG